MKRKATRQRRANAIQQAFFKAAGPNLLLLKEMLDRLPNVSSYIKDAKGRFMAINRRNCEQCGFASEDEVIGKRSSDFFAPEVARHIMSRDQEVLKSGQPIVERKDIFTGKNPSDAIAISIYPVKDLSGRTIGTACVHYLTELDTSALPTSHKIQSAIAYLRQHFTEQVSVKDLPQRFGLSSSTFYRLFTALTKVTPSRYLSSLRLCHARKLLETTNHTIADIAQECGFYDHSHFVHAFCRERGLTPGEYRRHHRT